MSLLINTKNRSNLLEIMDDFSLQGDSLYNTLDQLATINKWLGGNRVTLQAIKKLLKNYPKNKEITVIDLGCGNGDMLRIIYKFLKKRNYKFKLIGVDANVFTINYAKKLSRNYPEITYLQHDIFSEDFKLLNYDLVLATLFYHHFKENELINLLSYQLKIAKIGIVINDLHRHRLAYYLFKGISLFIKNPMVKQDGLTSILRGFKRNELITLSEKLKVKAEIKWKWAFRFQWILYSV